jgi:hypothetical protein
MQSYRVFLDLASFLSRVLNPTYLEPITLFLVRSCSVSFLLDVPHALACACEGDVHRGEILRMTILLVICLCLTLFYDATENSILHSCWLHLTLDAQVKKNSIKYLNLVYGHVAEFFGSSFAVAV